MITTTIHGRVYEIDSNGLFSPAEEKALEDWLKGMRAQDAAQARHRSPETINTHRKSLREKTCQHSGEGVLVYCLSKGYIRPTDRFEDPARTAFCLFGTLSATVKVSPSTEPDHHFHRAQAQLRTRKGVGIKGQKSAVAPLFREPTTGDSGYYEIPACYRKRMARLDLDNVSRLAAYADRVQAHLHREADAA